MLRTFVGAVLALILLAGVSLAEEVKGKVKSVDSDKGTITVTVDDKDQTLSLAKDAKLSLGKKVKEVKDIPPGSEVTLVTGKQDGKDVVTEIKPGKKKDKQ